MAQGEIRVMSRVEINTRRLLGRCELMAKEDSQRYWKLEKYILALDELLKRLQIQADKPPRDTMSKYIKRIDFLKGIVETAKIPGPIERVVAAQMLPKTSNLLSETASPSITTQIHQKTTAKYNRDVRAELFNSDGGMGQEGLRQRLANQPSQDEDLDAILKYNRNMQEKIAENMLMMTKNMKEHALTASAIIKSDISSLDKSDKLTETNAYKLNKESLRLEEHTKSTWRCWLWLMIAFVMIVFFNMIFFMKIAKKKM
ncbi:vesicle transport protein USE1 [Fopius arisanus]|uniref:Vesicle transport protein USE1 n=2 Tax=Fopius arisanus TaxID=64838 RepID=A0A9R1U8S3_9HYME|nr:PREDICTED: vesicle transport protein USE1 [Fopius arisanus]XP_011311562.1 PREDICTED: vesicle transport protein USE1 [Fopius arisanus]XP_011311563.1 PREDICTED: vesicle transport protein USE1 [Fopius arisanus]